MSAAINEFNPFSAVVQAAFDEAVEVYAEYGEGEAFDRATPPVSAPAGEAVEWLAHGLRADAAHQLRVVATAGARRWVSEPLALTTPALPEDFPVFEATGDGDYDPDEVICTNSYIGSGWTPVYFCVDRWGEPRWWLRSPDEDLLPAVRALSDGRIAAVSKSTNKLQVYSEKGELTHQYTPSWFEGRTRFEHTFIDTHEVIELAEGPWAGALAIITSTQDMVTDVGRRYGGGVIVITPDDGEVLWDWSSHGELGDDTPIDPALDYARQATNQDTAEDWLHTNALVHGLDADGGQFFLASMRYQDWVIKIDVETDAVAWRFGYEGESTLVEDIDAEPPAPRPQADWMYHQHAPEFIWRDGARGEFVLFDNGNYRREEDGSVDWRADSYSRIVSFVYDEEAGLAAPTFVLGAADPDDPGHFFADYAGDADLLPGGDRLQYMDFSAATIVEVTYPGGEEIWRLQLPVYSGYRANYFPSLYETTWRYEAGE